MFCYWLVLIFFRSLYSPDVEGEWLSSSSHLLLALTQRSPDYDRTLFDKPLSDMPFREYSIDPSWQSKAIPLTPLFAASQPGSQDEFYDAGNGMLRPTQTPLFSATQTAGGAAPSVTPSTQGVLLLLLWVCVAYDVVHVCCLLRLTL